MARFKPARPAAGKKALPAGQRPNAIGCLIVIGLLFLILFIIMYLTIRQGLTK